MNVETSIDAAGCQESSKIARLCANPPPPPSHAHFFLRMSRIVCAIYSKKKKYATHACFPHATSGFLSVSLAPEPPLVSLRIARSLTPAAQVTDQVRFDVAFAVDCSDPAMDNVNFDDCDHHSFGTCVPTCVYPYSGLPTATCGKDGLWVYGGGCSILAVAYSMGLDAEGQLAIGGPGPDVNVPQPLSLPSGDDIVATASGGLHTLLLTADGAYAAGSNERGQLGLGLEASALLSTATPRPLPTPNGLPFRAAALGTYHTVLLDGVSRVSSRRVSHGFVRKGRFWRRGVLGTATPDVCFAVLTGTH